MKRGPKPNYRKRSQLKAERVGIACRHLDKLVEQAETHPRGSYMRRLFMDRADRWRERLRVLEY